MANVSLRSAVRLWTITLAAAVVAAAGCAPGSPAGEPGSATQPSGTHVEGLGRVHFPTSGSGEAQDAFLEGVLLLHSFEYEDAAEEFRRARELDPDLAMAYWGEAMTHNHPIWMQQDRDAALEVLAALGETPAARLEKAATEREKDWLRALDVLYGTADDGTTKEERDDAYRLAMRRMHERYPDDHEVAAFYALSILGSAHEGRDFATYMRAAAVVEPVFADNPEHPGAAHYLIHSYDDPIHAPLGLPAARAYSEVAPEAAHAQHMTSHIFVAMGMWDDVVAANEAARDVQDARLGELGRPPNRCGHYSSWLEYGYLQQGRVDDARHVMDLCHRQFTDDPENSSAGYFAAMRARYVIDSGEADAGPAWPAEVRDGAPAADYLFTDALAALRQDDVAAARDALGALSALDEAGQSPRVGILELELQALLDLEAGRADQAVERLQEAVSREEALPYEFGPPATVKPPHELLGEVLLELGRPADALDAFSASLQRTPRRVLSLRGLAAAADAVGDATLAADARAQLQEIRGGRETD